jgi:hypothetical protein
MEEMNQGDVAFEEILDEFDCEALLVNESGQPIADSFIINTERGEVDPTEGNRPKGYLFELISLIEGWTHRSPSKKFRISSTRANAPPSY